MLIVRKFRFAALAIALVMTVVGANANDDLNQRGIEAFDRLVQAIINGPEALAEVLAPEFQIIRSDGSAHDRDSYIQSVLPTLNREAGYSFHDVVVTTNGDLMVMRALMTLDATVNGKPVARTAPRLAVFRKIEGRWQVAAVATFGVPAN